jgi:hypothetical protein
MLHDKSRIPHSSTLHNTSQVHVCVTLHDETVATLAWAYDRSKGLQGCGPREKPGNHFTCSWECKECEGMNPHTPK